MRLIEKEIESIFLDTVKKIYPEVECVAVQIQATNNEKFGDYQTNFAMVNSKALKSNPRSIAQTVLDNLENNEIIDKLEIAGPGFINIFIKNEYLSEKIAKIGQDKFNFDFINKNGDLIIDYSSPNIAKRMHIGHLRSTVIGDSIKRIYKYLGYKTVADNHIGDWGTQFGKLIVGYDNWLNEEAYKADAIEELERIYVEFSNRAEENPSLEDLAREELAKLQQGDERNTKLWKEFIKVSLEEYDKVYSRLGISFDTYNGESFYNDMMPGIIKILKENGLAKEDNGAQVVFFEEEENLHPCIVQKTDGAFLYATSDLATIQYRKGKYDINKIIYVTDERQQDHFRQVFKIAEKLGWDEERVHIWFGIMRFADGIFSSRKGNVIKLTDLLDEAVKRAYEIVNIKNPLLSEEEKQNIAEIVGVGAVKYADLSQNRQSAIIFEWDKILSFEGNTSPYLQYVYARVQSLLKKAKEQNINDLGDKIILKEATERTLALALLQFPNVVISAANSYKPNLVADYIFETAKKFNTFYNAIPILREEDGVMLKSRLLLAERTGKVIKDGMELLGIKTVDRM